MRARPQPVLAVATTCGSSGIAKDVVSPPVQPFLHDKDRHGLDPRKAAIVDGVVHNVVDAALDGSTGQSVIDPD
jgi:hypothetical protein